MIVIDRDNNEIIYNKELSTEIKQLSKQALIKRPTSKLFDKTNPNSIYQDKEVIYFERIHVKRNNKKIQTKKLEQEQSINNSNSKSNNLTATRPFTPIPYSKNTNMNRTLSGKRPKIPKKFNLGLNNNNIDTVIWLSRGSRNEFKNLLTDKNNILLTSNLVKSSRSINSNGLKKFNTSNTIRPFTSTERINELKGKITNSNYVSNSGRIKPLKEDLVRRNENLRHHEAVMEKTKVRSKILNFIDNNHNVCEKLCKNNEHFNKKALNSLLTIGHLRQCAKRKKTFSFDKTDHLNSVVNFRRNYDLLSEDRVPLKVLFNEIMTKEEVYSIKNDIDSIVNNKNSKEIEEVFKKDQTLEDKIKKEDIEFKNRSKNRKNKEPEYIKKKSTTIDSEMRKKMEIEFNENAIKQIKKVEAVLIKKIGDNFKTESDLKKFNENFFKAEMKLENIYCKPIIIKPENLRFKMDSRFSKPYKYTKEISRSHVRDNIDRFSKKKGLILVQRENKDKIEATMHNYSTAVKKNLVDISEGVRLAKKSSLYIMNKSNSIFFNNNV